MSAASSMVTGTKMTIGRLTAAVDDGVLTLVGEIDDQATLSDLVDQIGPRVVIDLKGVRFINSVGVREWIVFLGALAERGTKIILRACSEPMVHQMSMVVEARGSAEVESFCAPFLCDDCASERSLVLDVAQNLAELKARRVPPQKCPDCGGTMRFDDFPNRYLLFLD
jgi:anti-anti-sigma regulatory factor